jgi:hypothetical protein
MVNSAPRHQLSRTTVSAREITVAASGALATWLVIAALQFSPTPLFGSVLGGDFVQFYAAGQILNQHGNLYDIYLQKRLFNDIQPGLSGALWYGYSPTLALLFQPFTLFSFPVAYALWALISIGLYCAGLWALMPILGSLDKDERLALCVLALSFYPFMGSTVIGGQVSALTFALIAWAIRADRDRRYVLCGALAAACGYKPTMFLILSGCFLVRGNLRLIGGAAISIGAIFVATVSVLGFQPYISWAQTLIGYASLTDNSGARFLPGYTPVSFLPQLVDLSHFFQRIFEPVGARVAFVAVTVPAIVFLLSKWRHFDSTDAQRQRLNWALALTATLLINLYVMMYDAILAVLAFLLAYSAAPVRSRSLTLIGAAMYLVPFCAAALTGKTHIQPFTIVLSAFGFYCSTCCLQRSHRRHMNARLRRE